MKQKLILDLDPDQNRQTGRDKFLIMQTNNFSSLLPKPFHFRNRKVYVFQPQIILIDFHGTISERRWEDKVITPYISRAAIDFLRANWLEDSVQRCIPALKNESFEASFRHRYDDAPVIAMDSEETDNSEIAHQVGDFILWQIKTKKETKETHQLQQLIWIDGFKKRKIFTPIYEDVMNKVKLWKEKYKCSIYITSSIDEETLKVYMENTDHGNLHQYISGYLSSKKPGDKLISETYRTFSNRILRDSARSDLPVTKDNMGLNSSSDNSNQRSHSPQRSPGRTNSISSITSDSAVRPVLFLTDSGQEAKAASSVNNHSIFDCVLVSRPGNKRIRSYYLSRFQYISSFEDLDFVRA